MPKILIIDDEPDVLEYLRRRLQTRGYDVATASSGFEVSTRIKQRYPDVKTLFISGYTGMEYLRQASL
jgi:CheY-like chemotaxis protein